MAAVEGVVGLEKPLDVLLGHRLTPQAGGLECFGTGPEDLTPADQAVRELDDLPGAVFKWDAAAPTAGCEKDADEDPVITQVRDLLDPGVDAPLRAFHHQLDPLSHLCSPSVELANPSDTFKGLPYNIRAEEGHHGVKIAAVESVDGLPCQRQVLLRHRPRSIPPGSAAFHAKQQR
jgi:hypothetical protein